MARRILSDEIWEQFEAALKAVKDPRGAPPNITEREFLEAVLFPLAHRHAVAGSAAGVRQVECCIHALPAVGNVWRGLWEVLQQGAVPLALQLFVDSTSIPVHPHAAGAPKNGARQALGRSRRADHQTALRVRG